MECKCGASMKDATATNAKVRAVFEYQVCRGCGRNDYGYLYIGGALVATGNEAQRAYFELIEGPAPAPVDAPEWRPASSQPTGTGLIRVRFAFGGYAIERPSYFAASWDLIDGWQPYDNGPALAASFSPTPIPLALRVGTAVPERQQVARPMPPPRPAPESVPIGATFSLF
jgi:hypothetical protein